MKKIALILAILMLASLLTACGGTEGGEVMVDSVADICGMGSVGLADRFAGVVSPQGETKIERSDSGMIGEIMVEVGDQVEVGQVLFTYDTEQISLDIERAQLELEQMRNNVSSMNDEKAELIAEKATVSEELQLSYTIEIRDIEASIQEVNYNITLKSKEIQRLNESVSKSQVKSPAAGRIQSINENGGYDDMGNPLPIMTIVQTGGYRIMGYVNEANAYSLYEGMAVVVRSRVTDDIWYGSVSMVDWESPRQNNNDYYYYGGDETQMSSSYPFYVELQDSTGLMLGQHIYIEPDYGQTESDPDRINLPSYYISDLEGKPFVWAQNSREKLEKRYVTLGSYDEMTDTYVIEKGLSPEDYITFPDEGLSEGMTCVTYIEEDYAEYSDMPMDVTDMGGFDMAENVIIETEG